MRQNRWVRGLVLAPVAVADADPRHDPVALGAAGARPGLRSLDMTNHPKPAREVTTTMAMTAAVKDELSRVDVPKPCCRRAEMAALLRFAGGLHIVSGRVVVEAELDTGAVARRLRREVAEVYGYPSEIHVLASGGLRKGSHYIVRVVKDGEALARQTGLLDVRGRPVRGLPPHVVSANVCCAVAAWRGAFMAHGSLTEPGRSCALEITCPGPESALALVGAARRIGITAKAREVRGVDRVVVKDGDAIAALLTRIGAHASVLTWEERQGTAGGSRHREPAGELRRREPASLRARRGGGRRPGHQSAGDPRRRRSQPPHVGRPAAAGAPAGLAGGTGCACRPAADQRRDRGADPAAVGARRQARAGPRNSGHRGGRHTGDARLLRSSGRARP